MPTGDIAYLALVIGAMTLFGLTLAYVSSTTRGRD